MKNIHVQYLNVYEICTNWYKRAILKDRFLNAYKSWVSQKGDETLRLNYNLDSNSIVFDLGGYEGEFANDIYNKYGCVVYVFEPVKHFYEGMEKKFKDNSNIKIFHFGLSDEDKEMEIFLDDDSSSVFAASGKKETIYLKDITSFITSHPELSQIDLMKINIEGGEFQVLPSIIKSGLINKVINLQIQFHTFIENAVSNREIIREHLSKTHTLTYDYWFVWEGWTRNKKNSS